MRCRECRGYDWRILVCSLCFPTTGRGVTFVDDGDGAGFIDDAFVAYLFQIIEELSDDVNDPYHYPVIRVLVSLSDDWCHSIIECRANDGRTSWY